jgi:glycine cleavage system H protein
MSTPKDLLFLKTHEWADFTDATTARIGISDFAQHELGDLVFVNLPAEGDTVTAGTAFGDVESVKAVSDIISPVTGVVSGVNAEILDSPEKINEQPYGSWFIEVTDITAKAELLTTSEYDEFCKKEAH